jgi:putative membrane protein
MLNMRKTLLAASLAFGLALPGAAALAAPDAAFLRDAVAGSNSEIILGRLAQGRSRDDRVREFGRVLVRDHQAAKQQALSVARNSHIRVDARAVPPDGQRAEREMSRLRGRDFDRMFAHHMVEDHQRDIAKFEQQANGRERVTARLARETLPHLRHHLEMAQSLDR